MDTTENTTPDCTRCGHSYHCHYNATANPNYTHGRTDTRKNRPKNRPCHRMGKHDRRCECRNYTTQTTKKEA